MNPPEAEYLPAPCRRPAPPYLRNIVRSPEAASPADAFAAEVFAAGAGTPTADGPAAVPGAAPEDEPAPCPSPEAGTARKNAA